MTQNTRLPKIIWILWLQGWDVAPPVAHASLASWRGRNPDWHVNALDLQALSQFIPASDLERIIGTDKEPEAASDQIRIELLHRYGGVWADATTICARSLDDWLHDAMASGFFAFSRPGPDRMLSSWFLAAEKGSYVVEVWRAAVIRYWFGRLVRDDYFWFHKLFATAYEDDDAFRVLWDAVPEFPASNPFHFGPNSSALLAPPTSYYNQTLSNPPTPVFKLTHKFSAPYGPNSLMNVLCSFGHVVGEGSQNASTETPSKRLLIGWYGAFLNHGTIGDLRSLESVVSHLVGRGHTVMHATAADIEIPGAERADWQSIEPHTLDGVLFVCGPILKNHPQTRSFFDRFSGSNLAGLGVSILPMEHANYHNPFGRVFARQGYVERFGDVAITAPQEALHPTTRRPELVIGLALRGFQSEYGAELCMWEETEAVFGEIVQAANRNGRVKVVTIENHLTRSGISPDEIERQYSTCDLVLTSRFHGAVTAMRKGVPFIAIDQIRGGAKIYDLLLDLGWPHIYKIDQVNVSDLIREGQMLLQKFISSDLISARNNAVADANRTLCQLDEWVASL